MHFVVELQKRRRKAGPTMPSWRWKLIDSDGAIRAEGALSYASVGACERAIAQFRQLVSGSPVTGPVPAVERGELPA
jgi:hypothetical protein